MKQVTFAKGMRAQGFNEGDKRVVPDDMAEKLRADGTVCNVVDFPEKPSCEAESPSPRQRRNMRPRDRDLLSQTYLTK